MAGKICCVITLCAVLSTSPLLRAQEEIESQVIFLLIKIGSALTSPYTNVTMDVEDPEKDHLVLITARFPRGPSFDTNEIRLYFDKDGTKTSVQCMGHSTAGTDKWMLVEANQGMTGLSFSAGGEGTIDLDLAFIVPKEVSMVSFSVNGVQIEADIPIPR